MLRGVICLCLAWVCAGSAHAQSPLSRLDRVFIVGHEYIRLEDWARGERFQVRWILPKQQIRLVGPGSTLVLCADSRKVLVNGIAVWIAAPIVMRNNSTYIAPVDLVTAIYPLLNPVRTSRSKLVRTICLDPGHGGRDPGNQEGRSQEKTLTLQLADELRSQLTRAGFRVFLTRRSDSLVELLDRPELARQRGADLYLSLHFNSADGPGGAAVRGTEVYCLTPARTSSTNARGDGAQTGAQTGNRFDAHNILLSYQIQRSLVVRLGAEDRGVRRARFAVLRAAEMPAALIEGGFMTNPGEFKKIRDPAHRRKMAQAIVEGIRSYKAIVER
jgi:N-acetylmuramoyl-L-alanine amidase